MGSQLATLFSEGRYEEVLAAAAAEPRTGAANPLARYLEAQAHYHLGEYFTCAERVEETLAKHTADAPLEIRLQLASLLAKTLMQQGEFESALEVVGRAVPAGASAHEEYGETLLAAAWSAYFLGRAPEARGFVTRIFECTSEHFTRGRAALVAGLAARKAGEKHAGVADFVKAHHHLTEAQQILGNPEPIRALYLAQVEIARHGGGAHLERAAEAASRLPAGTRIARFVADSISLYRRHLAKESIAASVLKAVAQGVKRPWVALLPGAGVVAPDLTGESTDAYAAPAAVAELRAKLGTLRVRKPEDATLIRKRKASAGSILHVEPDAEQAALFDACLEGTAYSIGARVASVPEALDAYLEHRPAVVVLDLLAPGALVKGPEGATAAIQRLLKVDERAKIVVTYTLDQKYLFMGAIRAGARAHVKKPFEKPDLVGALHKATNSRSGLEALRVPTLELRRPIACTFKPMVGGVSSFLKPWQSLVARVVDPMGIETALDRPMVPGEVLRLNLELPGTKPLATLAEVASCRPDLAPRMFAIRLSFIKFPAEAKAHLEAFITDVLAKGKPGAR